MTIDLKAVLEVDSPARKWQHAVLRVEIPNGWGLNPIWGRYQALEDIHLEGGRNGEPLSVVVGLRKLKEDANE